MCYAVGDIGENPRVYRQDGYSKSVQATLRT